MKEGKTSPIDIRRQQSNVEVHLTLSRVNDFTTN